MKKRECLTTHNAYTSYNIKNEPTHHICLHNNPINAPDGTIILRIIGDYRYQKYDLKLIPSSVVKLFMSNCSFDINDMPNFIEEITFEKCVMFSLDKLFIKVKPTFLSLKSQSLENEMLIENNKTSTLKLYASSRSLCDKLHTFTNLINLSINNFSSMAKFVIPPSIKSLELITACYQNNTINNFLDNITFNNCLETLHIEDNYVQLNVGKLPTTIKCLTIWSMSKYMSIEKGAIPLSVTTLNLYYADVFLELYLEQCCENNYPRDLKNLRENKIELQEGVIPCSIKILDLEYNHYENKKISPNVIPNSVEKLKLSHNMTLDQNVIPNSVKKLILVENILDLVDQQNVIPNSVETLVCLKRYEECVECFLPISIKTIIDPTKNISLSTKTQLIEITNGCNNAKVNNTICFVCDKPNEIENCCNKCMKFMCHYTCCKFGYYENFKLCPICYQDLVLPVESIIKKEPIELKMSDIKFELKFIQASDLRNDYEMEKLKRLQTKICNPQFGDSVKLYLCSPFDYPKQKYLLNLEKKDIKSDINRELKKQAMYASNNM